ncbi:solute carrier family 22 member 6 isoform X3 [Oncorhynchus mykiss]|uniref:solute carrier family 22 member 6 isoform X3 n=1 Tax=Oncorhynchus mykiss TaxID=8022 RepID=UPI00187824A8|nr:solute carrier family 22 member 6 isoform X3 [Oncorhynchus mykiss]
MAPLQLAVYLRLALIFFFTAFLFFLDVFTVSRAASSCANVPSQLPNKSQTGEDEVSSSSARKQNRTPGEVREMNVSLISVLLQTQDEITQGNDTDRDNGKVCLDPVVLSYSQTMYMAGLLLGSLFGGALSDRYGKRVVLLVCVCVHAVTAVLPAVLPHAILFLTLRCLAGVSCCCINICSFSLGVEWSLPRYRIWPPALLSFSFSLGMMALAPLAYLTHTWTQLHLALAVPQILCLPLYYSIPESPHWLLLKKRLDTLEEYRRHSPEDKRCLDLLLETEGKDLQQVPWDTDTLETGTHILKADTQTQEGNTLSHCGHMRSPNILLRLVIMSYIGQKCVGLVCLCYRVGCILNAVVSPRGETIPLAAMILYGSGPIVGAGLCLLLPETSGVPLPDSLEDCDRQPRLHLPLAWSSCFTRRSVDTPADKACPFLGDTDPGKTLPPPTGTQLK